MGSENQKNMEVLFYYEEINKQVGLLLDLIEQQAPDSDRINTLSEEYLYMLQLQSLPIEELCADPWVQDNLKKKWEE